MLSGIILTTNACKKDQLDQIDPDESPSELSRAFVIPNAINRRGEAPASNDFETLKITTWQASASVTADNYLFIPFMTGNSNEIEGVYLQVEGADNYWEIPLEPGMDATQVLNVGIPANITEGRFNIDYRMYGPGGLIGNTVRLNTAVTLPEDLCNGGSTLGRIEGLDGITVKTFNLGSTPGWVTVYYDTYTVPDRIDIRYGKQWVRSTGSLMNTIAQPLFAKPCSQTSSGDGYVGQSGVFEFYHDPTLGDRFDIYVSGCLDGGTQWWVQVEQCPVQYPVLGIHANDPGNGSPFGHAWISITENGLTEYYGLWPDAKMGTIGDFASDVRHNVENGYGQYTRYYALSPAQLDKLKAYILQNKYWVGLYNCSSFARDVVQHVTGEYLETGTIYNGDPVDLPAILGLSIIEKELQSPTTGYFRLLNESRDAQSCSMCP